MRKAITWIMAISSIIGMICGGIYSLVEGIYGPIIVVFSLIFFVISLEIFQRIKGKRLGIKDIAIIVLITPLLVFLFDLSVLAFMWESSVR